MTQVETGKIGVFNSSLEIEDNGTAAFSFKQEYKDRLSDVPGALAMSAERFKTLKAEAAQRGVDLHTYLATYMSEMID